MENTIDGLTLFNAQHALEREQLVTEIAQSKGGVRIPNQLFNVYKKYLETEPDEKFNAYIEELKQSESFILPPPLKDLSNGKTM